MRWILAGIVLAMQTTQRCGNATYCSVKVPASAVATHYPAISPLPRTAPFEAAPPQRMPPTLLSHVRPRTGGRLFFLYSGDAFLGSSCSPCVHCRHQPLRIQQAGTLNQMRPNCANTLILLRPERICYMQVPATLKSHSEKPVRGDWPFFCRENATFPRATRCASLNKREWTAACDVGPGPRSLAAIAG